jgi:putative hydrolase of the HAD superfamily
MNQIKNIVFDLGGVIIDLNRQESVDRFIAMGIADADEMLNPYHQSGVFLQSEDGTLSADEFIEKLSEISGKPLSYEIVANGWLGFLKKVSQEKLDYILSLRSDYKIYLLSNTNPFVMNFAHSTDFCEAGKPITDYFDKIYASCEMKVVKPHCKIFELMLADSGMIPSETLFLDDGAANVKMGAEMGLHTYQPEDGEDWRATVDELLGR